MYARIEIFSNDGVKLIEQIVGSIEQGTQFEMHPGLVDNDMIVNTIMLRADAQPLRHDREAFPG